MISGPSTAEVTRYYDENAGNKVRDFVLGNPRVEKACQLIRRFAPDSPKGILEIGAGIGHVSWRMAKTWPAARVVGAELSSRSVELAKRLFAEPNLIYHEGIVTSETFDQRFDMIVLMDIYEHVSQAERPSFHHSLSQLLSPTGMVIVTCPTVAKLQHLRIHDPKGLQPVDEDITSEELVIFARDLGAKLIYHAEVDIWDVADYTHSVIRRGHSARSMQPIPTEGRKARLKRATELLLGRSTSLWNLPPTQRRSQVQARLGNDATAILNDC